MPTGTVTDARSGCVATRVAGGVASLSGLSPRSKRMGISQMYMKLGHELLRATLLALTLYNIYIYRHESP
jgi:hypothetical protein